MENGKQPTGKQAKEVYSDNPRYPLFKHLADEYSLLLLDSELDEIINISNKISEQPTEKQVESDIKKIAIEYSDKVNIEGATSWSISEAFEAGYKHCKEQPKQVESDAVEFAEWSRNRGYRFNGNEWRLANSDRRYTGIEIYEIFKNR